MHTSSLMKCFNIPRNSQLMFVRALSFVNHGKNYYKTLELEKTCSDKDVRDAYIRLSKEHHPDKNPEAKSEMSEKRFIEINEAYSVLSKPATRRRYDAYLDTWDSNSEFSSTYEELTYRYNQHHQWMRKKTEEKYKMETPVPLNRLLLVVIGCMFFIGIIEFKIVQNVVQGPDEVIEGIPIFHSNMVGPDLSRMTDKQKDEYHSSKRRIIENTVRSMKAENESRTREQNRLRIIIQNNEERKFE